MNGISTLTADQHIIRLIPSERIIIIRADNTLDALENVYSRADRVLITI